MFTHGSFNRSLRRARALIRQTPAHTNLFATDVSQSPAKSQSTTKPARRSPRALWTLAPIAAVGVTLASGLLGAGAYGAFKLNRTRTRWFSDKFVLTPESLRMPYKSVHFETEDGVQLEGWFIEQTVKGRPSERVVLTCNPYNHDKSSLLAVARALWDTGHSVLLYDFRAFGPKPASHETIGHLELRDGRAAFNWLREHKPSNAKIGIMGCSMGGAVSLMLAEEDDTEVVGVATDCAFACLQDVVQHWIQTSLPENLPGRGQIARAIVYSLATCNSFWYGYELAQVGPYSRLERLRVPLLILHSEKDSVVPLDQAFKIYQGAATPDDEKELVVIKACEHIGSFFENEIQYTKRIVSFLDRCFESYGKEDRTVHEGGPVFIKPKDQLQFAVHSSSFSSKDTNSSMSKKNVIS